MGRLRSDELSPRRFHPRRSGHGLVAHDLVGRQARTATPGRAATGGHSTGTGSTAGGGRHLVEANDPTLLSDLQALLESSTRGDPQSPLRWTCKSTRNLAEELNRAGHHVTYRTVAALLHDLDYSLQANRKTKEGSSHPDRNAQFEYINRQV